MRLSGRWQRWGQYAVIMALSLGLAWWVLGIKKAGGLGRVWTWSGDLLVHLTFVKNVEKTGWYMTNPELGAPFGMQLYDFPMPEGTQYLILKAILGAEHVLGKGKVMPAVSAVGLFYLLSFPLVAWASYWVLRKLRCDMWLSALGAMLYTFLPFHFLRMTHLMLASYWMVPLACWLAIELAEGRGVWWHNESGWGWGGRSMWARLGMLLLLVILGTSGAYYTVFTIFFIAMAVLIAVARFKKWGPIWDGILIVGVIGGAMLANMAPSILYHMREGPNRLAAHRYPVEAELYALKLTQLLMPRPENRWEVMSSLAREFEGRPLTNENATATLGLGIGLGCVALLGSVGCIMVGRKFSERFVTLSILNLSGILYATIAGVGAIVAVVFPQIRALNRISIFLAFFCVVALLVILNHVYKMIREKVKYGDWVVGGVTVGLATVLLMEMIAPSYAIASGDAQQKAQGDLAFVSSMEKDLPAQAMVFMLPHMEFPEQGPLYKEEDYEPLRLYLASKQLRFSYGVMKGRSEGQWMHWMGNLPTGQMVDMMTMAGYKGIVVNTRGYAVGGDPVAEITKKLNQGPAWKNESNGLYGFNLLGYAEELKRKMGNAAFEAAGENIRAVRFHTVPVWQMGSGFMRINKDDTNPLYGIGSVGQFDFGNPNKEPIRIRITMPLAPAVGAGGELILSGVVEKRLVLDQAKTVQVVLNLPPGKSALRLAYRGGLVNWEGGDLIVGVRMTEAKVEEYPYIEGISEEK